MQFDQLNRRDFITLLGGAPAWPLAARAQQTDRVPRIGVLMGFPESDSQAQRYIAAFRDGLHKLGWTEGRNLRIDTRWATPAEANLMRQFAKELVALQPDLILSNTTPTTTLPLFYRLPAALLKVDHGGTRLAFCGLSKAARFQARRTRWVSGGLWNAFHRTPRRA
jgi:hypothetical protein